MKNFLLYFFLCFSSSVFPNVLFFDNFTVDDGGGNINYFYSGRQSGELAPAPYYTWARSFDPTLVTNSGPTAGKLHIDYINSIGSTNSEWVGGPNINFTNYADFAIEFKIIRLSTNESSRFCLSFGKDHVPASYWSGGGMSFELFGSGKCILYKENDQQIGQLWLLNELNAQASPEIKIKYVVSQQGFPPSGDAQVALFINDIPYPFASESFIYAYANGFSDNFISFEVWDGSFDVEYLKVTSPEGNIFQMSHWTGDGDSGISTNKIYTHLIDCGNLTNTEINGVTFIGTGLANAGSNWIVKGSANDLYAFGMADLGLNPNLTGGSRQLTTNALYSLTADPAIALSGLVPGQEYILTLYNQGLSGNQLSYVATSDGEAIKIIDQSVYGNSNGMLLTYRYRANEDGCFALSTTATDYDPWAVYAVSNEEIPEPFNLFIVIIGFGFLFYFKKS